jgi:5-methylcytosine-specific restriction endonuclease McrA
MCNSAAHNARPGRESLSKRLGKTARLIRERDGHACHYCGATAEQSGAHLHLDHLTPKAHGGADVASNLVLACRRCNSARQDLTLSQWARKAARELGLSIDPRAVRAHARRALAA